MLLTQTILYEHSRLFKKAVNGKLKGYQSKMFLAMDKKKRQQKEEALTRLLAWRKEGTIWLKSCFLVP